jgi:DNA-binding MarR family transcriptional regulator
MRRPTAATIGAPIFRPVDAQYDFGHLLSLAHQIFITDLRHHLEQKGYGDLGLSHGYVLRMLVSAPATVGELARTLDITPQGASLIARQMARNGYITITPDARDGRARVLALADRGRAVVAEAHRFHQGFERQWARALGADDVATVRRVLTELVQEHPRGAVIARWARPA